MPKVSRKSKPSARRYFSLHVSFDEDRDGPHEVTFPVHGFSAQEGGSRPPGSIEHELLSAHTEQTHSTTPGDDDSDPEGEEEAPFSGLMDKPFYGTGSNFHYYIYDSHRALQEPPPHPSHIHIRDGTIFIHRDTLTGVTRSWRWEASGNAPTRWNAIQQSEQRVFDHGTYHYTLTKKGVPSWIRAETLRKKKYSGKGNNTKGREEGAEHSAAGSSSAGAVTISNTSANTSADMAA